MMKKALSIVLTLAMSLSLFMVNAVAADYTDTAGHWGEDAIDRWSQYGIVEGVGDNEFAPDGNMTRAQSAVVFSRLLNLSKEGDISKFTDVNADDWFAEYIAQCVAEGIMSGTSATTMSPNDPLTREMMFVMFCRALGIKPQDTCDKEYSDYGEISSWAVGYVNALVNEGIVGGVSATELAPDAYITRASVMKVLDNAISVYANEDGQTAAYEGDGIVLIAAKNVTITDAPAGTVVVTAPDSTGATVDDVDISRDTIYVVGDKAPSGGGSSSGGGSTGGSTTGGSTTGGTTTGGGNTGSTTVGEGTT